MYIEGKKRAEDGTATRRIGEQLIADGRVAIMKCSKIRGSARCSTPNLTPILLEIRRFLDCKTTSNWTGYKHKPVTPVRGFEDSGRPSVVRIPIYEISVIYIIDRR